MQKVNKAELFERLRKSWTIVMIGAVALGLAQEEVVRIWRKKPGYVSHLNDEGTDTTNAGEV